MKRSRLPCGQKKSCCRAEQPQGRNSNPAHHQRGRRLAMAGLLMTILATCVVSSHAQFVNRSVARWSVRNDMYGGRWHAPVQYGAGGYYPYGGQTAYGNAVRAQAELTMAQGRAAQSQAIANENSEKARKQYIENKARYEELRREQRGIIEARKAKEREAQRQRAASRKPKAPTDLYPRLAIDQLDRTTGDIVWPKCLTGKTFDEDRQRIESSVQFIAQHGPDQRSAGIIDETAKKMKKNMSDVMKQFGFQSYSDARKFLSSLSVEGYYAMEEL
jgi:sRNA-binding protein